MLINWFIHSNHSHVLLIFNFSVASFIGGYNLKRQHCSERNREELLNTVEKANSININC